MATHSSVLAWRIPGTGEPGGLPSMGSHRVGHDWSDLAAEIVLFEIIILKMFYFEIESQTFYWWKKMKSKSNFQTKWNDLFLKQLFLITKHLIYAFSE